MSSDQEKINRLERDLKYVQEHSNNRVKEIEETLEHARGVIQDQNEMLAQITFVPSPCAVVLHHEKNGKTAFISHQLEI